MQSHSLTLSLLTVRRKDFPSDLQTFYRTVINRRQPCIHQWSMLLVKLIMFCLTNFKILKTPRKSRHEGSHPLQFQSRVVSWNHKPCSWSPVLSNASQRLMTLAANDSSWKQRRLKYLPLLQSSTFQTWRRHHLSRAPRQNYSSFLTRKWSRLQSVCHGSLISTPLSSLVSNHCCKYSNMTSYNFIIGSDDPPLPKMARICNRIILVFPSRHNAS